MEGKGYKKEIQKNIDAPSCPICFNQYDGNTNIPKLLDCAHTICIECLNIQFEREERIICPFCQLRIQSKAENLKTNYALLEIVGEERTQILCSDHHEEVLAYCESDNILLCMRCVSEHKQHSFFSLSDPKARKFVKMSSENLENLESLYIQSAEKFQEKAEEIDTLIKKHIEEYKNTENYLIEKIKKNTQILIQKLVSIQENRDFLNYRILIDDNIGKLKANKKKSKNQHNLAEIIYYSSSYNFKNPPDLSFLNKTIENLKQKINYEGDLLTFPSELSQENSINSIKIFRHHSKKLISIDLANLYVKTETDINIPFFVSSFTCLVSLENNSIFCFGNELQTGYFSGDTFTIDANNKAKILNPGTPCIGASGVILKDFVYVFGGWNGDYLDLAEKYDLNNNVWIKLQSLPLIPGYCPSVCSLMDLILICGYRISQAIIYNT